MHAAIAILVGGLFGATSVGSGTWIESGTRDGAVAERMPLALAGVELTSLALVTDFYVSRDWLPVWTHGRAAHPLIHSVLHYLAGARDEGLDPVGFHVDALTALAHLHDRRLTTYELARRDILLTDAVFSLGRQFAGALLDPGRLYDKWASPVRDAELAAPLAATLETGRGLRAALDDLRPDDPAYARLRDALRRYRAHVEAGGWSSLPEGPILRSGDAGPLVAALRARLAAEGYDVAPTAAPDLFDDPLAVAVADFQSRHDLYRDGIVGPATRAALDVPAGERVAQIAVNLERLRWQPRDLGERFIRVNIPEYRLEVIEDGETALSMRAVVGRVDRPTPVLSAAVTYLEINPSWNIPQKIARDDVLPRVRRDPDYLAERDIRVYENWRPDARELEPHAIDWQSIEPWDLSFKLRQEPGPLNALGRIKFMFANPFSVYIHDTPNRDKFGARRRCYSSGCVRVESPLTLATYLLQADDARGEDLLTAVDSRETLQLGLPRPLPVHLVYLTAWADEEGVAHFREDVYDYDGVLRTALTMR